MGAAETTPTFVGGMSGGYLKSQDGARQQHQQVTGRCFHLLKGAAEAVQQGLDTGTVHAVTQPVHGLGCP